MIIRTTLSLIVLAALSVVANAADDYEYNYEEYENGEEDVDHEEEDKEVNYEQVGTGVSINSKNGVFCKAHI